jgi:hypothetical protein
MEKSSSSKPSILASTSLLETASKTLKPPPATITGLLHHGNQILSGPPKLGKSYLALQLAHAVASGEPALGTLTVERRGRVLYLALEDGECRLSARSDALLKGVTAPWLSNVDVVYSLPESLDTAEGMASLDSKLATGDYELCIIDTFVSAFPSESGSRDLFRSEYRQMAELTKLAQRHDLAILTVAHTRKGDVEDGSSIRGVAGTGGRTAAADAVLMFSGMSGKPDATLTVISRDTEGAELKVTRDADTTGWRVTGAAHVKPGKQPTTGQQKILDLLADRGPLTRSKIEEELSDVNGDSIGTWLHRLCNDGRIAAERSGLAWRYVLAGQDAAAA